MGLEKMKNKKKGEKFCNCIPYGKIEPKKLERLQKSQQRQMCTWKDIAPFDERRDDVTTNSHPSNSSNKLLFPPIYELPCITNPEVYRAMYNTGGSELISDELHTKKGHASEETKAAFRHYGCSIALRSDNFEDEENGFTSSDRNEPRNKTDSGSLRLKLPKLTNSNVVNQRL